MLHSPSQCGRMGVHLSNFEPTKNQRSPGLLVPKSCQHPRPAFTLMVCVPLWASTLFVIAWAPSLQQFFALASIFGPSLSETLGSRWDVCAHRAKEMASWKKIASGSGDESNAIGREKMRRIPLWRDDGVLGPTLGGWGSQQMLPC